VIFRRTIHDYCHRITVHHGTLDGQLHATGTGPLRRGDHIWIRHDGQDARCTVTAIEHQPEPAGTWTADLAPIKDHR